MVREHHQRPLARGIARVCDHVPGPLWTSNQLRHTRSPLETSSISAAVAAAAITAGSSRRRAINANAGGQTRKPERQQLAGVAVVEELLSIRV